jgi:nucleoside-diphosphate-sugar epimerase
MGQARYTKFMTLPGAYDISRIMADTGWRPAPLEDAFRDYFVWLQTHDV